VLKLSSAAASGLAARGGGFCSGLSRHSNGFQDRQGRQLWGYGIGDLAVQILVNHDAKVDSLS
jgi:hypothetical protein